MLCSVYEYELPTLGEGPCAKLPQTCFSGICACYKAASCRGGGWHLLAVVPTVLCGHWGQTHQGKAPLGLPPSWSRGVGFEWWFGSYRPSSHKGGGCAVMLQMDVSAQNCALCVLPARLASFRNFAQHEERGGGDFQTA